MFFDPLYVLFALPGLILAVVSSLYTRATFSRYSKYSSSYGYTGAQAAKRLLRYVGVDDVSIERAQGFLSDHYDPSSKTLRLSSDVYDRSSLSAIGVACHEAGHAIQHYKGYAWLNFRSLMVPVTQVSSNLSYVIIMLGFLLSSNNFILLGSILFSVAVLFSIITLPVEWDASRRAKELMVTAEVILPGEEEFAGKILNAAFLTYVASAVSALLTLFYYLIRSGFWGSRED